MFEAMIRRLGAVSRICQSGLINLSACRSPQEHAARSIVVSSNRSLWGGATAFLEAWVERDRTIRQIITDAGSQASRLLRAEASLARAETSENFEALARGLAMIIAGATLLIPGLVLVLQAAAAAVIAAGLADYWALAIFGGGAVVLGLVLTAVGRRRIKISKLKPTKTLDELNRDAAMAMEKMGSTHGTTQRAA